jgi:hypothetical protein
MGRERRGTGTPVTRRAALAAGGIGLGGLSLPRVLRAEPTRSAEAAARSVVIVIPWGGPAQHDTLDPKPHAPAEIRSPFLPIATKIPGVTFSEHLPELARMADRFAVIRSMSHAIATHNSATHYMLTGRPPTIVNQELVPASRRDWPSIGSMLARLLPSAGSVPAYVQFPLPLIDNSVFSGGQHSGFLDPALDPFVIADDPNKADFRVKVLDLPAGLSMPRLAARRELLARLEPAVAREPVAPRHLRTHYDRAYRLLEQSSDGSAFDVSREPAALRDRYGRSMFGQSLLLARRLVEAGTRILLVCDTSPNTNGKWDTHSGGYDGIRKAIRESDKGISALLTDLAERGLLDSTLVLWMAEFGRTPKVRDNGGRDHWPFVYSLLLAGAGVRGGAVLGASDANGAYPKDNPVRPEDVLATICARLGVDPHAILHDAQSRPFPITEGQPVAAVTT